MEKMHQQIDSVIMMIMRKKQMMINKIKKKKKKTFANSMFGSVFLFYSFFLHSPRSFPLFCEAVRFTPHLPRA